MQIKKNPKANLENYSKMFMQLGLVLALLVVYLAIEKKTYDRVIEDLGPVVLNIEDEEQTVNSMTNWLMGVFKDNPWLLDFLKENIHGKPRKK